MFTNALFANAQPAVTVTLTDAQQVKIDALNAVIEAIKADVPTMRLAKQISQAKQITDTMRGALMATCSGAWENTCYVCHQEIEPGEETKHKAIDPISNRQAWDVGVSEAPIFWQSRHAYHESFTNEQLGYDAKRNKKLRDAYRTELSPKESRRAYDDRMKRELNRQYR